MKKKLLLMLVLVVGFLGYPNSPHHSGPNKKQVKNKFSEKFQPVMFLENNVEFLVFPDGSIDFVLDNINPRRSHTYTNRAILNRGMERIYYYQNGLVALIDGIPLAYDRLGRIKRIGNTDIHYNPGTGYLKRVGNLHLNYNRKGEMVQSRGFVNEYNRQLSYQAIDRVKYNYMIAQNERYYESNRNVRKRR